MDKTSDGFVRADQIDLKSLDEQLERHLNRAWTLEKNKKREDDAFDNTSRHSFSINVTATSKTLKERQEWEIDTSKLIIKAVIARGTFGTVHRGIYDGQDVAGQSLSLTPPLVILAFFFFFCFPSSMCNLSSLIDCILP